MTKKILLATWGSRMVASSRVRTYQFVPYLRKEGWLCRVLSINPPVFDLLRQSNSLYQHPIMEVGLPFASKCYSAYTHAYRAWNLYRFRRQLQEYDVVLIQKVILDEATRNYLKSLCKQIVFEFDDAIYTLEGQLQAFDAMLELADVVITTNQESMRYAQKFCSNVVQIIGPIDTNRYLPGRPTSNSDSVVIGWIGSPYTSPELMDILDRVLEVIHKRPGTNLYAVGAGSDLPRTNHVTLFPWKYETELDLIGKFDIGIMPLRDTPWNRGKGGYKLLQYMSCGIPSVASPVGINCELIDHAENGMLASTSSNWQESLLELIDSSSLRQQMSVNAREKAVKKYSLEVGAEKLINVLESLL
jgi:glycosyltransferase involved in cell wall biosynthesis